MRKSAKKVLVILTDRSSGIEESVLRTGASQLENKDVEIIAVSIGDDSDITELAYVTPHTDNIIDVPIDEDPNQLSAEIVKLIRTGWLSIQIHTNTFLYLLRPLYHAHCHAASGALCYVTEK